MQQYSLKECIKAVYRITEKDKFVPNLISTFERKCFSPLNPPLLCRSLCLCWRVTWTCRRLVLWLLARNSWVYCWCVNYNSYWLVEEYISQLHSCVLLMRRLPIQLYIIEDHCRKIVLVIYFYRGWMFLLVPAHLGCPGQIPQSHKTVVCVCIYFYRISPDKSSLIKSLTGCKHLL